MIKKVLITGAPGVGKTTLIKKVAAALAPYGPCGFYTEEIRKGGTRAGFELVSLDGRRALLSHTGFKGPVRVGRYGVDIEGFERFLSSLDLASSEGPVIIDEIGKMECASKAFRTLAEQVLGSERLVVATIALKGDAFMEGIKRKAGPALIVTASNRDSLFELVTEEAGRPLP